MANRNDVITVLHRNKYQTMLQASRFIKKLKKELATSTKQH